MAEHEGFHHVIIQMRYNMLVWGQSEGPRHAIAIKNHILRQKPSGKNTPNGKSYYAALYPPRSCNIHCTRISARQGGCPLIRGTVRLLSGVERGNPAEWGYAAVEGYALSWNVCHAVEGYALSWDVCEAVEGYALSVMMSARSISARGWYCCS